MDLYNNQMDTRLFQGCCLEADRADAVSLNLDGLRNSLAESFHGHMIALTEEIRVSSRILRELVDRSQVHFSQVPYVLNYLNVILPCLCRTLRDIVGYYEDKSASKEIRWRKMYHKMTDEVGGLPLPQRFVLYNHYLTLLKHMLTRSPDFDPNLLEQLRSRILELREKRGIAPPPVQVGPVVRPDMFNTPLHESNMHWAELIFTVPLSSRTALKSVKSSKSYGPHQAWGHLTNIPNNVKILFRKTFDNDKTSLTVYLNNANQSPYLLMRTYHMNDQWFSLRGAHELCIRRQRSSLQLKRWSRSEHRAKLWASLYFQTWEEMVLFYCAFVALKARNTLTLQLKPDEFKVHGERRLFQAQIIDDGYKHSLIVYEDAETKGIRLHAAVWEGELVHCPVWTAFVTHRCTSTGWLERRSKHRIWLKDIQLYVFCHGYRQKNQRQGRSGAFELYFISEEAAQKFKEVFIPATAPTVATDSTDNAKAGPSK